MGETGPSARSCVPECVRQDGRHSELPIKVAHLHSDTNMHALTNTHTLEHGLAYTKEPLRSPFDSMWGCVAAGRQPKKIATALNSKLLALLKRKKNGLFSRFYTDAQGRRPNRNRARNINRTKFYSIRQAIIVSSYHICDAEKKIYIKSNDTKEKSL